MTTKVLPSIAVLLMAIQFVRPARNLGEITGPSFIGNRHAVPAEVEKVLQRACYDCHSNRTSYPWYADVQPVGWWLEWHVRDGKKHFNFSEFGSYSAKRADHKLEELSEEVREHKMPLKSYTWMHPEARLSDTDIKLVADWAADLRKSH